MNWDQATATIGSIVQEWTVEDGPGGSIVLFDDRAIRADGSGGLADLAHDLPFRTDTAIRYASVSKHFLTALLLTGAPIQFSDRLSQHLLLPEAIGAVTVGRALDMTGGLPDLVETLGLLGIPSSICLSRHRMMDAVARLDRLNFVPGREISYSNTGYRLVQAALMARGIDYPALLRERLFRPLGLNIRLPEDDSEPVPGLATGYWKASPLPRSGWRSGRYGVHISASGGLAGNALDLATWGQALLAGHPPASGLLARLTAPRHLIDGRATDYGLGLQRSRLGERLFVGHGGSLPGYRSHLLLDPAARVGVVVLSNREDTDAGGLALRVLAALHDLPLPEPAPHLLPAGLFVTAEGPFWLRHQAGQATFMGASETLFDAGGGWAVNRSAPLPMRLTAQGTDIIGEIGHATRHFRPVPPREDANPAWAGTYTHTAAGYPIRIDVTVDRGIARLHLPPLGQTLDLRPLDPSRALAIRMEGQWSQPFCVTFAGGALNLATQRARSLVFTAQ